MKKEKQGWKFLQATRFAHFFVGTQSLCGRWMALTDTALEDNNHDSIDNCKSCMKKRLKLIMKGELK